MKNGDFKFCFDKNDNIGLLKDNELFERLFYQCGKVDDSLMKVGMVCSLFYLILIHIFLKLISVYSMY